MTELEKMKAGELYDYSDPEVRAAHVRAVELCDEYNNTGRTELEKRERILRELFGALGKNPLIEKNIEASPAGDAMPHEICPELSTFPFYDLTTDISASSFPKQASGSWAYSSRWGCEGSPRTSHRAFTSASSTPAAPR